MLLAEHGLFHHVYDLPEFELPFGIVIPLPNVLGLQITKFMVLQVVAALLTLWIFSSLARRVKGGNTPSGWWWNFWEMLAVYLRDEVVRPIIGDPHAHHHDGDLEFHEGHGHDPAHPHGTPNPIGEGHEHSLAHAGQTNGHKQHLPHGGHPADKYVPFVWTCFFYILICNLLGAIPWLGAATGDISVTIILALMALGATFLYGAQRHGAVGFWLALVPSIDAPGFLKVILWGLMFVIELLGFFIKHTVLAVRLFINMMAGHTVLAVILGFIAMSAGHAAWWIVAPSSIAGQVGVGLLELLVAFLQAYVFCFLMTIFISMSLHEH